MEIFSLCLLRLFGRFFSGIKQSKDEQKQFSAEAGEMKW